VRRVAQNPIPSTVTFAIILGFPVFDQVSAQL
jgi:hypothetical protein